MAGFALSSLNVTKATRESVFVTPKSVPQLHVTLQAYSLELQQEVVVPVENSQYGVITSDEILEKGGGEHFGPLTESLDPSIWIVVCILVVAVTLSISANELSRTNLRRLVLSMFSAVMTLIEQSPNVCTMAPHASRGDGRHVTRYPRIRLVSALWLMTAFLVTNCYKGVFKSNYMFEPVYTRNWTRGLLDLDNFTFFLAFEDETIVEENGDKLKDGYHISSKHCEPSYMIAKLWIDPRGPCTFVAEYTRTEHMEMEASSFLIRERLLTAIHSRFKLVPISQLKNVIRARRLASKTIFVSPRPYFDSDWNSFRETMSLNRKIKFTHYYDSEDTTLKPYLAHGFTRGLHPRHNHLVPRRLKTLFSSGIWALWKKWDKLRQTLQQGKNVLLGNASYLPISLHGSDVLLVFELFGLCVIACVVAFVSELVSSHWIVKKPLELRRLAVTQITAFQEMK